MKNNIILAILAAGMLAPLGAGAQQVDTVFATNSIYEPMGVAAQGDYIYVTASVSNRIVRFHPGTGVLDILAGSGAGLRGLSNSANGTLARFSSPQGIIVARGGLVVSDSGNHVLRLVGFNGAVSTLAGTGTPGADDGAAATASFNNPVGLAVDASGNLYIADAGNNRIRILYTNDTVATLATFYQHPVTAELVNFYQPHAVAVGENGDVWVADTRNHAIVVIRTTGTGASVVANGTPTLAAGSVVAGLGVAGGADADNALEAAFNGPRGLLWVGGFTGLLVSDTGNNVIRRVSTNSVSGGYSTALVAGGYGAGGFVNGALLTARFRSPVGVCRDLANGGFFIVDRENAAVRRLQTSPPQPRITNPRVGYIRMVTTASGVTSAQLTPVTQITLNNVEVIGADAEAGTQTYFTTGPTPADPLDTSSIPDPGPGVSGSSTAPAFANGQAYLPETMVGPSPDFIVKVRGSALGRQASEVVQARFIFQVATPIIRGENAAYAPLSSDTVGARMFYTTNGVDPVDGAGAENFGPLFEGDAIQLGALKSDLTIKVRAFRDNFKPSDVAIKTFYTNGYSANKMSLGFMNGEGSSKFTAAPGQRISAPVTLALLPGQSIYSMTINLSVTNLSGPPVSAASLEFVPLIYNKVSLLGKEVYIPIEPNYKATNNALNLLMLGWMERKGFSNLYNNAEQDLVTYSGAYNYVYKSSDGRVTLGEFRFDIPMGAAPGSVYRVQVGRPSGVYDGIQQDIFIDAPEPFKDLPMVERGYVVGDCMPFGWFNSGDFGDSNILANDLLQVFQEAGNSKIGTDFLDAMDSCCGDTNGTDQSLNALFVPAEGTDLLIDTLSFGNGKIEVNDLYVSFRRAMDPSRVWYARYWPTNPPVGARKYMVVRNQFRGNLADRMPIKYSVDTDAGTPFVRVTAGDVTPAPGQEVEVPISAALSGGLPLRVFWLRLAVDALDGSPAITEQVRFVPNPALGAPTLTDSRGPAQFGGCWLDASKGLAASGELGKLVVKIPATATASAAYKIAIRSFSGSPNGVGVFPYECDSGLLTLSDRSASVFNDGIPDSWRLRHFNTVNNQLSRALADADGDGVPNWMEFKAGTNPNDAASRLRLQTGRQTDRTVVLRWPTAANKRYVIEVSDDLSGTNWTPVASDVAGDGLMKEFKDLEPGGGLRFYRVRLQE